MEWFKHLSTCKKTIFDWFYAYFCENKPLLCPNSRKYLHPSTVSNDVSFDASSDSSWHVPSPVCRFADTHHDVSRHVAAHLVAELRVMTSRGATAKRLPVSAFMSISFCCDATTLSLNIISASKQVRSTFAPIKDINCIITVAINCFTISVRVFLYYCNLQIE